MRLFDWRKPTSRKTYVFSCFWYRSGKARRIIVLYVSAGETAINRNRWSVKLEIVDGVTNFQWKVRWFPFSAKTENLFRGINEYRYSRILWMTAYIAWSMNHVIKTRWRWVRRGTHSIAVTRSIGEINSRAEFVKKIRVKSREFY